MDDEILFWGIIVFLFATLGIGVWASKQVKGDSENYLVAGRGLVLPLAAATLMAQSVDSNATFFCHFKLLVCPLAPARGLSQKRGVVM